MKKQYFTAEQNKGSGSDNSLTHDSDPDSV